MILWTHRGFPYRENTLEAFQQAYDHGIRFFETDVHATSDGVLVLSHDSNASRVMGINLEIPELSYEELVSHSEGKYQWCRLEELISQFPNCQISIDIKHDSAIHPLLTLLEKVDSTNLVLGSFSSRRLKEFKKRFPGICYALTTREIVNLKWGISTRKFTGKNRYAMVPIEFRGLKIINRKFVNRCHQRGILVFVWTINSVEVFHRLKALNVDGVISDDFRLFS